MAWNEERDFRLRPAKPKARNERGTWAKGFKLLMHYARSSSGQRSGGRSSGKAKTSRPHHQRCAVRIVYSKNTTRGQWRAHGRYIARESATFQEGAEAKAQAVGFNAAEENVDIAAKLGGWQSARDPLLWKVIVSPEFGDRTDLPQLTRDLMQEMQRDLSTDLEWVAAAHYNTMHPHIHVTIRGISADGQALRFSKDFIKQGVRTIAEDLCTRQLGYRTTLDAVEAERREITEQRFTSLDRTILREGAGAEELHFTVKINPESPELKQFARMRAHHIASRLTHLESMGLAEQIAPNTWRVQHDFETVLRAAQRTNDHQKTLAAHGALASDVRLPIRPLNWDEYKSPVEGRILVHGQEEFSGRSYLMLEGTDATIHYVQYTREMEQLRSQGGLRTNSFVRLRRLTLADGKSLLDVYELGNADTLLNSRRHFVDATRQMIKAGIVPEEGGWGGWLGKYQAKLRKTAVRVMQEDQQARERQRHRDRSFGR